MADLPPYEDQAVRYLLGDLPADERREFESRLAESAELRALLRELEDGSVALAMTVPQRRAPAQIWKKVEGTIVQEQKREAVGRGIWFRWWRYGWAAAAFLLMGWLFHAFWPSHPPGSSLVNSQQVIHQPAVVSNEVRSTVTTQEEKSSVWPVQKDSGPSALEVASLHRQLAELSNHVIRLSQSVAQQQALLLETNRLKFFQLSAFPEGSNTPMSPGLQRALFLAMAHELGWLPPVAGVTNIGVVDFIDLRSGSNLVVNPQPETQPAESPGSNLLSETPSGSVPGFQSGTNAFLAFDPTVVGPGTTLSFWTGADGQSYQLIGTSVQGNNPTVVTVPFSSGNGTTLTVTAGNSFGSSNVIGQFPPKPNGP